MVPAIVGMLNGDTAPALQTGPASWGAGYQFCVSRFGFCPMFGALGPASSTEFERKLSDLWTPID